MSIIIIKYYVNIDCIKDKVITYIEFSTINRNEFVFYESSESILEIQIYI